MILADTVQHISDRRSVETDDYRRYLAGADVPVAELLATHLADDGAVTYSGRAYAAVKMAMGSDAYSDEDRADAAAEIVAKLLADNPGERIRTAPMERVQPLRPYAVACYCAALYDGAELPAALRPSPSADAWRVPSHLASVTRLFHLACHLRRTLDRNRVRDAEDCAQRAADSFTTAGPEVIAQDTRETVGTPDGAHRVAMDMLAMIGMRPLRRPDRPVYSLAYAAARASAGLESGEIAEELGVSYGTLRNHLSAAHRVFCPVEVAKGWRAPECHTQRDYAAALAILDSGGAERPRVAPMPESNGIRSAMKDGQTAAFPNVSADRARILAAPLRESRTRPTRKPWDTVAVGKRRGAAWTRSMPARSQSRLAAAATHSRRKTAAKTDAQRSADRKAAGILAAI